MTKETNLSKKPNNQEKANASKARAKARAAAIREKAVKAKTNTRIGRQIGGL